MSAINIWNLSYDPADVADSHKVGSYMLAGDDGTAIGHVSDALKVNLTNASVDVTATNLDIRDLTHVSDSVKVGDGTDFLAINGDGSINATVSATNLDIRDLTHASDSVKVGDGTDFLAVNNDGSINAVVTATNLDIRDLTHASDSVKIGDGTDFLAINTDGSLNVASAAYDTVSSDAITVGTSAVELVAGSPVANRRYLLIQNISSNPIYIGASGVTTSNGVQIPKSGNLAVDASQGVYAIAGTASNAVRILELGLG